MKNQRQKFRIILFFMVATTLIFSGCNSKIYQATSAASKEVNESNTQRYGSGSYSDAASGYSKLTPQYSRINKLYDDGEITASERDTRKRKLNTAYKKYNDGQISHSEYKKIEGECINE